MTRPPHKFQHVAMNTPWSLFIDHDDPSYAAGGAAEAFAELARWERILSRFLAHGELALVNRTAREQAVRVSADLMAVLIRARALSRDTDGAFDLAAGSPHAPDPGPASEPFALDEAAGTVRLSRPGAMLDAGGVGKGVAIDAMARLLREDWDLPRHLVSGGGSTVLAGEAPHREPRGWLVRLPAADGRDTLPLLNRSLSASGMEGRAAHILDPRTGEPCHRHEYAWSLAPGAAEADALSTAFMVMTAPEVEAWIAAHPGRAARLLDVGDGRRTLRVYGDWPAAV